jgi:hypothetical protein
MTLRFTYSSKEGFVPQNPSSSSASNESDQLNLHTHPHPRLGDGSSGSGSGSGKLINQNIISFEPSKARPKSAGSNHPRRSMNQPSYPLWHQPNHPHTHAGANASSPSSNLKAIELDWNSSSVVKLRQRVKSFQQMFSSSSQKSFHASSSSSDMNQNQSPSRRLNSSLKSKLARSDASLSEKISSILNWIRLREGYMLEVNAMISKDKDRKASTTAAATKTKKKDQTQEKDKFLILFQALRKITYRIVESYSILLSDRSYASYSNGYGGQNANQAMMMVEDIRVYVANLVYCYALPAEPFHSWIRIDCSSNPLLCRKKVDGATAILKQFTSYSNSDEQILAQCLRFSADEEAHCIELQQLIWSTFTKYQDEKMMVPTTQASQPQTQQLALVRASSSHSMSRKNVSSRTAGLRPSTAGSASSSFRQRFDSIIARPLIPSSSQATAEMETEILTIDHDAVDDEVESSDDEDEDMIKKSIANHHTKRGLGIWMKEIFYWKRIRSYMRHRRRMIYRKVIDEFQRNHWQSVNYRRLQWKYLLQLQRLAFDNWRIYHRQHQRVDDFQSSIAQRYQRDYFTRWKTYLSSHHEQRDFKRRLRARRLVPLMNAWKQVQAIQRYQRRWSSNSSLFYQRHQLRELFNRWRRQPQLDRVMRICARYRNRVMLNEAWKHWQLYVECAQILYDSIPIAQSPFARDSDVFSSPRSPVITAIAHPQQKPSRYSQGSVGSGLQEDQHKLVVQHAVDASPDSNATMSEITVQHSRPSPIRIASGHRGMLSLIQESRRGASTVWSRLQDVFRRSRKDLNQSPSPNDDPDADADTNEA